MTTFTIDTDNNITAFAVPDQAEAVIAAGAQPFGSSEELAGLAAGWPAERLVAIWNSLPGVTPAKGFKNPKSAATKIWSRIQNMAEPEKPIDAAPKPERKPKGGAQGAKGAPTKGKSGKKKATPSKKAPQAKKPAKDHEGPPAGIRGGTKTAEVLAMLKRKNGATISEIMDKTGRNTPFAASWPGRCARPATKSNRSSPKAPSAPTASTRSSIRSFPIRPPGNAAAGFSTSGSSGPTPPGTALRANVG
jgi:hypothetical protein